MHKFATVLADSYFAFFCDLCPSSASPSLQCERLLLVEFRGPALKFSQLFALFVPFRGYSDCLSFASLREISHVAIHHLRARIVS
jgi:hypothetical protein